MTQNRYLLGLVLLAFTTFALANDGQETKGKPPHHKPPAECEKIAEACKAAGFTHGKKEEKKGLMHDCIRPLMNGETVAGVTVTPADVAACKAAHPKPAK